MPRLTHDPLTGRAIHPQDDYDYARDPCRLDERRMLPNDTASVAARQKAANDAGQPYFPTPWECVHIGKWWNVPEEEQAALIDAETAEHPWQEIIETKLSDSSLYYGAPDETPTPWDGSLSESANWGNIITVTRIGVQWLRLQPDALGRGMAATKTISSVMRKLGWKLQRTRVDGMPTMPKVWVKPDWSVSRDDELTYPLPNTSRRDDDDIPF